MPEGGVFNNRGPFKLRYARREQVTALAGFLGLCLAVGLSGSGLAAFGLHGWYLSLHPPRFAPPVWVFLPVWSVLYLMAGLAAWEIWRVPDAPMANHQALSAWGWQLGLKALGAPVFFGAHWLLPAVGVQLALCGAVFWTILRFARLNLAAAALMLPYLGWVTFELYLNAGFWWLNR